ncbi:MAG: hypothetical protein L0K12_15350, partial [Brevibacterium aurantiacum]|nr:hypothetical protein [Brevibacterium aurantiacum]
NTEIDELAAAATKAEGDDRSPAYAKLFQATTETGIWVPLVQPVSTVVVSNRIESYVSNADVTFDFAKAE